MFFFLESAGLFFSLDFHIIVVRNDLLSYRSDKRGALPGSCGTADDMPAL